MSDSAEPFFRPRTLAIVGASETGGGGWPIAIYWNLEYWEFPAKTYLVNPNDSIWGALPRIRMTKSTNYSEKKGIKMAGKLQNVKVTVRKGIAWVMLNRPEKRNAMSPSLHYEMDDTLRDLESDPRVAVVVIGGEGGYFSAGQDLREFSRETGGKPHEKKRAAEAANRWRWKGCINMISQP